MLQFVNYNIVFQEVPNEVTLAINISNCPNRCKGCHSQYLMQNIGEVLDQATLAELLDKYKNAITCVCFMGGDSDPNEIESLALFLRNSPYKNIKTAWYSGKKYVPDGFSIDVMDYIKLGPYVEELGGLDSLITNQKFYKIKNGRMIDATFLFEKKGRIFV